MEPKLHSIPVAFSFIETTKGNCWNWNAFSSLHRAKGYQIQECVSNNLSVLGEEQGTQYKTRVFLVPFCSFSDNTQGRQKKLRQPYSSPGGTLLFSPKPGYSSLFVFFKTPTDLAVGQTWVAVGCPGKWQQPKPAVHILSHRPLQHLRALGEPRAQANKNHRDLGEESGKPRRKTKRPMDASYVSLAGRSQSNAQTNHQAEPAERQHAINAINTKARSKQSERIRQHEALNQYQTNTKPILNQY